MSERYGADVGVTRLLENFSNLLGRNTPVYFSYRPNQFGQPSPTSWSVWEGAPAGTGGSLWGTGATPASALHDAYTNAVQAVFHDRLNKENEDGSG